MTISATTEPLDHPSYLVRQRMALGPNTAGASTISGYVPVLFPIRIRGGRAGVRTAGTSAGNTASVLCYGTSVAGTTTTTTTATIGTVTLTTNTAMPSMADGGPVEFSDMNVWVQKGSFLAVKNGTDATGVYIVELEWYHDPVNSAWTPGN